MSRIDVLITRTNVKGTESNRLNGPSYILTRAFYKKNKGWEGSSGPHRKISDSKPSKYYCIGVVPGRVELPTSTLSV